MILTRLKNEKIKLNIYTNPVDKSGIAELTKNTESVVERYDDDVAVTREHSAVIGISRVPLIRLPVNEHHHGKADGFAAH